MLENYKENSTIFPRVYTQKTMVICFPNLKFHGIYNTSLRVQVLTDHSVKTKTVHLVLSHALKISPFFLSSQRQVPVCSSFANIKHPRAILTKNLSQAFI